MFRVARREHQRLTNYFQICSKFILQAQEQPVFSFPSKGHPAPSETKNKPDKMKITNKTLNGQPTQDHIVIASSRDTVRENACMRAAELPGRRYTARMNSIGYSAYVVAVATDEYQNVCRVYDAAFSAANGGSRAKHKTAVAAVANYKHLRDNPVFAPTLPLLLAA